MNIANILITLELPKTNVTDEFGAARDWALPGAFDPDTNRPGWHPDAGYRPVHYGVDYSGLETHEVFSPGEGLARYDKEHDMITFIPTAHGTPADDIVIYLRHVVTTHMSGPFEISGPLEKAPWAWLRVGKGESIGELREGGPYAAHLHFEVAVSLRAYNDLTACFMLSKRTFSLHDFGLKALDRRGIIPDDAVERVDDQIESDEILCIEENAVHRKRLPRYKLTWHNYLGRDTAVMVDPLKVIG